MIFGCQGVSPLCFLNSIALFISRSRRISNEISLDCMCKKYLEGQLLLGPRPEIGPKNYTLKLRKSRQFCQQKYHQSWRKHRTRSKCGLGDGWMEWVIPLRLLRLLKHLAVLKIKTIYNVNLKIRPI